MTSRAFIEQEIPRPILSRLPQLFMKGHHLANSVIRDTPCLNIPSVQAGDIRAAAIDFTVCSDLQAENYPGITAGFSSFHRPTGKYFEIQTQQSRITISHIAHLEAFPRHAEFRKNAREGNSPYLFASMEIERKREEAEELDRSLRKHILVTYGDQNLEFLQIGMLLSGAYQAWAEPPINLLDGLHLVVDNKDDTEAKDSSIPMGLKQKFIEHLSQNAQK